MRFILAGVFWAMLAVAAPAQDLSGLARLDPARSAITDDAAGGVVIRLGLSQPVPWRVRVLDAPPRVVIDFREVDWTGIAAIPRNSDLVVADRAGIFRPGWSRLVLELGAPLIVARAGMLTGGDVAVEVTLAPAAAKVYAAQATLPEPADWALPLAADLPQANSTDETGALVVVLDPGHGGLDPGAERDGQTEADLMLTFARTLKEVLLRQGGVEVVLTRTEDVFVPLEARISISRAAGADVFLSLHADSLAEGEAEGATIYTLSEAASDAASRTLAERHDRDDLLAGIDLSAQDDRVAGVLMDMARTETTPRVDRLALALETALRSGGLTLHSEPRQEGGFSVLKSPDIPSALIELGFLSSAKDLTRLVDPKWRAQMADALAAGILQWARQDTALRASRAP